MRKIQSWFGTNPSRKKIPKKSTSYKRYTKKEEQEFDKYFGDYVRNGIQPSREDVESAFVKNKRSGGVLYKRLWNTIRQRVWGRIKLNKEKNKRRQTIP